MTTTDATHLLTACPKGGPDGECTLGDAVQRLANRINAHHALSAAVRLVDAGYLDHQRRGGVAYVAAVEHWHETAVRLLADYPNLLAELVVRS